MALAKDLGLFSATAPTGSGVFRSKKSPTALVEDATTEFASREFREIETKNLTHVPLGVDLQNFSPYRRNETLRTELLKGGDVLILHCGRMSKEKNPQNSILALKELLDSGVNARLIFVGMGPMFKNLKTLSKDLPVTFMGYIVDRKMLAEIIASADVSIAPGPIETFCLAALESLASGTPVVASSTSAVGEFLLLNTPEPVGAVAENNPKSFAKAIQTVLAYNAADRGMPIRCQHQAENYPWSSTLMMMLRLHGAGREVTINQKRLRAA